MLLCDLPFVYKNVHYQGVSQWPSGVRWIFSVALRTSTASLPCPDALIPRSIIILKYYDNIDNNIMLWHICNDMRIYLYYTILYWYQKLCIFFQQPHDSFSICRCCRCILFAVIRQKWAGKKWNMWLWEYDEDFYWYMALKCFNVMPLIGISITTILLWLNLVCKTGYYTFWIILTAQQILVCCTVLKGLSLCVAIVMNSKNAYMW